MSNATLHGTTFGDALHKASRPRDAGGFDARELTHRWVG